MSAAESLMNCRVCMASDCGVYYAPIESGGWSAAYQCSSCGLRATTGHGADQHRAWEAARRNWQAENTEAVITPTQEGR